MHHTTPRPSPYPAYYDIAQLAARLGVHKNTLVRWRNAGRMPLPFKFANRLRWKVETIDAWERVNFAADWKEPTSG